MLRQSALKCQKGVKLLQMRVTLLWIDMPQERTGSPLGADEESSPRTKLKSHRLSNLS